MQRARESADAATATAAAATAAPLLQLRRAAQKADTISRFSRAVELYERAIAVAELALPCNSLVVAALLSELRAAHHRAARANPSSAARTQMELTLRALHLLHAR
jgi:hypothetical protein